MGLRSCSSPFNMRAALPSRLGSLLSQRPASSRNPGTRSRFLLMAAGDLLLIRYRVNSSAPRASHPDPLSLCPFRSSTDSRHQQNDTRAPKVDLQSGQERLCHEYRTPVNCRGLALDKDFLPNVV